MRDPEMDKREAKLAAFLAKDEPPQRDIVFEAKLAMRRSQGQARGRSLKTAAWAIAAMVIVWALAPGLAEQDWWPVALAGVSLGGSAWLVARQFAR